MTLLLFFKLAFKLSLSLRIFTLVPKFKCFIHLKYKEVRYIAEFTADPLNFTSLKKPFWAMQSFPDIQRK